jgi:hypothetical protein
MTEVSGPNRDYSTADSDVDLILLTRDWRKYLHDKKWIGLFGEVEGDQIEDYGRVTSIRVWYKDRLEVEYGLTDETWANLPLNAGTKEVISDGMAVVFERDNLLSRCLAELAEHGRHTDLPPLSGVDKVTLELIARSNEYHPDYSRIEASALGFFVTYDEAPKFPAWDEATKKKLLAN